jgi:transposase
LNPVVDRSDQSFKVRALLNARSLLVATRTRLINSIRGEFKVRGARIPGRQGESFHRLARPQLPDELRAILEPLFNVLRELQQRIDGYDKQVELLSDEQFPVTRVLR